MRLRDARTDERPWARARLAARHAERLYPGPLGRHVAHERTVYAAGAPGAGGDLLEAGNAAVLERTAPRPGLVRSSELRRRSSTGT